MLYSVIPTIFCKFAENKKIFYIYFQYRLDRIIYHGTNNKTFY